MCVCSGLQGHTTSAWPGASGTPTECRQRTKSLRSPSSASTASPMRVITRMLTTTYGESVSWTPIWEIGEPSGPMENGMTYIVRPRIDPR